MKLLTNKQFFRQKALVELFKITLCISLPIIATYVFTEPKMMSKILHHFQYIKLEPARPSPSLEDFEKAEALYREFLEEEKKRGASNK